MGMKRKGETEILCKQLQLLAEESERMLRDVGPNELPNQMVRLRRSIAFDGLIRLILLAALADLVVGFFVLLVKGFGI